MNKIEKDKNTAFSQHAALFHSLSFVYRCLIDRRAILASFCNCRFHQQIT
jgi:hypothetical protein